MLFYKIRCKDTEFFANKQIKSPLLLKFSRIFLIFTKFSAIILSFGIIVSHFPLTLPQANYKSQMVALFSLLNPHVRTHTTDANPLLVPDL